MAFLIVTTKTEPKQKLIVPTKWIYIKEDVLSVLRRGFRKGTDLITFYSPEDFSLTKSPRFNLPIQTTFVRADACYEATVIKASSK